MISRGGLPPGISVTEVVGPEVPDVVTLAVTGDVDLAAAPLLRSAVQVAISRGCTTVAIDCSAVEFIDVSGIRSLIAAGRQASAASVRLTVTHPSSALLRALLLTGRSGDVDLDRRGGGGGARR
ncbi:MAG TPA: STAS domain-containing protein [Acidimicrobiales bacterium]|nr:STAS domain-containing protein [Acidimicrobiales bacterium]